MNEIINYVTELFNNYKHSKLLYHNVEHTQFVVEKSEEIARFYSINEADLFILTSAAWFHDTGQLFKYGKGHEAKSVSIMKEYFGNKQADDATVLSIQACIMATKMPVHPKTLLEEIICDADTYNLGTEDFFRTDRLLRRECELKEGKKNYSWTEKALKMLKKHTYHTAYCQNLLTGGIQENIKILQQEIKAQ